MKIGENKFIEVITQNKLQSMIIYQHNLNECCLEDIYNNLMQTINSNKHKKKIPQFISKLHTILQDPNSQGIIQWNKQKRGFGVIDQQKFRQIILQQYFKHSNLASFTRQLNMYCFRKIWSGNYKLCYYHQLFSQQYPNLLSKIKRKKQNRNHIWEDDSQNDDCDDLESIERLNKQASIFTKWCLGKIDENQKILNNIRDKMENEISQSYNSQFVDKVQSLLQFLWHQADLIQSNQRKCDNLIENNEQIKQEELVDKLLRSQTNIEQKHQQQLSLRLIKLQQDSYY